MSGNKTACLHRRRVVWLLLLIVILGASLRFVAIDSLGLEGSDNTYYTNIACHWAEGDWVLAIGESEPLYRPVVFAVFGIAVRYLGFNDWSIKTVNAGIDTGNILLVFLLASVLSRKNPVPALSAAAVFSVLPFTILIARSEQSHVLSTTTLLIATIFIALSTRAAKPSTGLALAAVGGLATGLAALTHEELIFTSAGLATVLLLGRVRPADGLRSRLIVAMSRTGVYLTAVFLVTHRMLLTHQAEAQERAATIADWRVGRPELHLFDVIERPFMYGWNAVCGTGSTVMACLVVGLLVAIAARFAVQIMSQPIDWRPPTLAVEDLPMWTVAGYLFLHASFFAYYAVRLFVPMIPLVIVWLFVRTASLSSAAVGRRTPGVVAISLTAALVISDLGHVSAIRSYEDSPITKWAPFSLVTDLRPDLGYSELRARLTNSSWARRRFDELGQAVAEDSRLLVGASVFHPFPGRRTPQIGFYFGDDAVYLFDHDQPVNRLIDDFGIRFALFTTHQTYDPRAVLWVDQQRYLGDGRWAPPEPVVQGASLGFSPGEYTIQAEFKRFAATMGRRGARIILGEGDLLTKRPTGANSPSFVVWALDPAKWPPLEHEIEAVGQSLELAGAGRLDRALSTLEATEVETSDHGRFRLRMTGARILAEHGRYAAARQRLTEALSLVPRDTRLCTALEQAFPSDSDTRDAHRLFAAMLDVAPNHLTTQNLLIGLAVNLADFAIEAGNGAASIDAFHTSEQLLRGARDRLFSLAVADWCAARARDLAQEGRRVEAHAGFAAAWSAYQNLLAREQRPTAHLLLEAGRTLSDLGRHEEAVELLTYATEVDHSNPAVWSNLCLSLSRSGAGRQGLEACEKALQLDPSNTSALTSTARLLARGGHWSDAANVTSQLLCRSIVELNDNAEIDLVQAVANTVVDGLATLGDSAGAANLSLALGRFLSARGRHEPALDALGEATTLAPDLDELWVSLCFAQRRAGKLEAALESCGRAIELNPNHSWARLVTAEILASIGRWPEAILHARTAVPTPPSSDMYTRKVIRLARGAADAGYRDQACNLLLNVKPASPRTVIPALDALGCD